MDSVYQFWKYLTHLVDSVPLWIYEGLVSVLCLGFIVLYAWKGWRKGFRYYSRLLLLAYVLILFCSTVFCRAAACEKRCELTPFWSYQAISDGSTYLILENIMNVVVFIPVGILLICSFRRISLWKILLIGCGISMTIEVLQYFYQRGVSELDDVIHNTLGCLIGGCIIRIINRRKDLY